MYIPPSCSAFALGSPTRLHLFGHSAGAGHGLVMALLESEYLTELAAHTHNYYARAGAINEEVWKFLRPIALPNEPHYERYQFLR